MEGSIILTEDLIKVPMQKIVNFINKEVMKDPAGLCLKYLTWRQNPKNGFASLPQEIDTRIKIYQSAAEKEANRVASVGESINPLYNQMIMEGVWEYIKTGTLKIMGAVKDAAWFTIKWVANQIVIPILRWLKAHPLARCAILIYLATGPMIPLFWYLAELDPVYGTLSIMGTVYWILMEVRGTALQAFNSFSEHGLGIDFIASFVDPKSVHISNWNYYFPWPGLGGGLTVEDLYKRSKTPEELAEWEVSEARERLYHRASDHYRNVTQKPVYR